MSVHATPAARTAKKRAYFLRGVCPCSRPSSVDHRATSWGRAACRSLCQTTPPTRGTALNDDSAEMAGVGVPGRYLLPAAPTCRFPNQVCDFALLGGLPARYPHLRLRPLVSYLLHRAGGLPSAWWSLSLSSTCLLQHPLWFPAWPEKCPISNGPPGNF